MEAASTCPPQAELTTHVGLPRCVSAPSWSVRSSVQSGESTASVVDQERRVHTVSRVTKLVITIVTIGLATAVFAGAAGAGSTLSKKEYLKQGNSICKGANQQLNAFFEEFFKGFKEGDVPSPDQQRQAVDGAIPIFTTAIDAVEALEGPPAFDKKIGKLLDQYRAVLDKIDADPSVAFGQNAKDPFAKPNKLAKKLGLKECAQDN